MNRLSPAFLVFCSCMLAFLVGLSIRGTDAQSPSSTSGSPGTGGESGLVTPPQPEEPHALQTQDDKVNYAIGVSLVSKFKEQGIDLNLDLVMRGMKDAASGGKLLLSDGELQKSMVLYHEKLRRVQLKARSATAAENKREGEAFLAENKHKEGVVILPSGLQYRIVRTAEGRIPTDSDTVECHYRGTLVNGAEFGNSRRTGRPATFRVDGVIPGWREALKLMAVGSTWQLFIPAVLAYGERGSPPSIGPNTALVYEVELLAIK